MIRMTNPDRIANYAIANREGIGVNGAPMPPRSSNPFDALVTQLAQAVADRIAGILPRSGAGKAGGGRRSKLRGRKLDMRCRYPGCKNKSKGPRFRFMCETHRKLPKAEQKAAL